MQKTITLALLGWAMISLSLLQAQTALMETFQEPDTIKKIKSESERPEWKTRYIKKLTQVSPRVHYGIGNYFARMNYEVPNIDFAVSSAINDLKSKYPWAPWNKVSVQPDATVRDKMNDQKGKFFTTAGINLPIIFIDIEASVGRYSQPLVTLKEVWPPWKKAGEEGYSALLAKRITTPRAKAAVTGRAGIELERLLPDHLIPRFQFGPAALGMDMSTYYVISADFSYRIGLESIAPDAAKQIQKVFDPVPLISDEKKHEAAQALVGHIESKIPSYFWAPAMHGMGVSGKVYLDIGRRFRFAVNYHHEAMKGMKINQAEWLEPGPHIWTRFITFGIQSKL